ncbi:MAG: OmpA family protein [Granulosicoccaceae bacterium]
MSLHGTLTAGRMRVEDDGWLPVADLMAGLMMAFVLVAMVTLKQSEDMQAAGEQKPQAVDVASAYFEGREEIAKALQQAFGEQLELWDARLDQATLSIDFGAPEINFEPGSVELNRRYRVILKDFFPRYLKALAPHKELIDEVRIEGHASSDWSESADETRAWFENMALSQDRTRAVLRYLYELPRVAAYRDWVRQRVVAVGMSSARLVRNPDGSENQRRSRRVSFRLITNADAELAKIQAQN